MSTERLSPYFCRLTGVYESMVMYSLKCVLCLGNAQTILSVAIESEMETNKVSEEKKKKRSVPFCIPSFLESHLSVSICILCCLMLFVSAG